MRLLLILLIIIIYSIYGINNLDDYQIIISQCGVNKLTQHLIPILKQEIMSVIVPSQIIETDDIKLEIDQLTINNFSIHNITVSFDQNQQKITMNIINMNLKINRFKFIASKDILIIDVSCAGYLTPEFLNWNISMTFNTSTTNCSIFVNLIEHLTIIQQGIINLNQEIEGGVCAVGYNIADIFVDIEQLIQNQIIKSIPTMINNEMQSQINSFLGENAEKVGDIKICYKNITIYTKQLLIAGDLITPIITTRPPRLPGDISTTPFIDDDDNNNKPIYDDASLFIFFLVILILSCIFGSCIGTTIYCTCNRKQFKAFKEYKTKQEPIKVADHDMTDDDDDGGDTK